MLQHIETRKLVPRQFIVAFPGTGSSRQTSILRLLEYAWQLRIVNIIAIATSTRTSETVAVSYIPFRAQRCEIVRPTLIGSFRSADDLHPYSTSQFWFPNKLGNLHGCPLLVATNEWDPYMMIDMRSRHIDWSAIGSSHPPFHEIDGQRLDGIEGRLVRELSARMHFRARVLFAREGESSRGMLENGSYTGIMGMVESGAVNLSIGMIGPTPDVDQHFRFSYPYYYEPIVYALPRGRQHTALEKLMLPFTNALWLACGVLLVVATLLLWALSGGGTRLAGDMLDVWSLFVGGGYTRGGRRSAGRAENGWLLLWLLVTLVLRSVYQGFMFTFMQQNMQVLPPNTVAEMIQHGYRFMLDKESVAFFKSFDVLGGKWVV